ncbi:protein-L-isoaspartate O-methyltransferase [Candidatus Parcubacteria bacterium]|nr:MAG: protein-L-isoaspartate O-methyltransferase [Candidatus Parcubacteria bacterium]
MASEAHNRLVDALVEGGYLRTQELIDAFRAIDRRDFVPENLANRAYVNEPLPIGAGQTISQPLTVAFMLELLAPRQGERVLDIGAGSGWQTAILSYVTARNLLDVPEKAVSPFVVGIERIPALCEMARRNVEKYHFLSKNITMILCADASSGAPREAYPVDGFHKIICAAALENEVPLVWKRQLRVGGRIVVPIGNTVVLIKKHASDHYTKEQFPGFRFVPFVSGGVDGTDDAGHNNSGAANPARD